MRGVKFLMKNFTKELNMIKYFKYIFAFFFIINACYATTTYTDGLDNGINTTKNDAILIGSHTGSFAGYAAPSATIKALVINFVQSGTVPGGAIATAFPVSTFPNTLKDLWIEGDATGFDVLVNGIAGNALPTPPNNCTIHFNLTAAPASDPGHWFRAPLGANCRIVVEPTSADPFLGGALTGLTSSNLLVLGANVVLPAGLTNIPFKIQRHPSITAMNAGARARLTMSAATTFNAAVNGISIGGAESSFAKTSDIIDPDAGVGSITVNGGTLGAILNIVSQAAPLPTLEIIFQTTGNAATTNKAPTGMSALPLPALSPALLTAY